MKNLFILAFLAFFSQAVWAQQPAASASGTAFEILENGKRKIVTPDYIYFFYANDAYVDIISACSNREVYSGLVASLSIPNALTTSEKLDAIRGGVSVPTTIASVSNGSRPTSTAEDSTAARVLRSVTVESQLRVRSDSANARSARLLGLQTAVRTNTATAVVRFDSLLARVARMISVVAGTRSNTALLAQIDQSVRGTAVNVTPLVFIETGRQDVFRAKDYLRWSIKNVGATEAQITIEGNTFLLPPGETVADEGLLDKAANVFSLPGGDVEWDTLLTTLFFQFKPRNY